MSESTPSTAPVERFTLHASPPVRPLAIAAGTVVVGAALLVLWGSLELSVAVAVLATVVLVAGVALAAAALVLTLRLRTEVRLDADAVTVVRRGQERRVAWREVTEVSLAHPRLSLRTGDRATGLVIVNPRRGDDPTFGALVERVRQRLDGNRGYAAAPPRPAAEG